MTLARNGDAPPRGDAHDATREDDFLYYLHRGADLLQKRRPEEARVALERAYQLSPDNPKAQNLLGLVYFKLGLLEGAKSIYDRMVEKYPSEPPLYVNLGLVLLRQGRLNEAERTLKKAITIAPDHHRAHCYLGLVLYRRGDLHLAREHFLRGKADEFALKVEEKLAHDHARPSQAEILRAVAASGFHDLETSATPFKPLDYAKDERVVRDEEAWEAMVTHGDGALERQQGSSLGLEVSSLLPVWSLTPLPRPIEEIEAGAPPPLVHDAEALIARLAAPLTPQPGTAPPSLRHESEPRSEPSVPVTTSDLLLDPATFELPSAILFGGSGAHPTAEERSAEEELRASNALPELVRDSPDAPGFHAGPGARARLVMEERAYLRTSAIVAASGPMSMSLAASQLQGNPTGVHFGDPEDAMCVLEGNAILLLRVPRFAVALRGVRDLYVVESALIGFDKGFTWDNGKVLGMDVVTLRGSGSLLLDTRGDPMLIPVDAETPVHAAREGLLAWSDGVRPSPAEGQSRDQRLFRLRGRGYVLVAFPPEPASNHDKSA